MTTTLTDAWAHVRTVLDIHAPSTARTIRTSATMDDISEAQSVMAQTFPDAVRDQFNRMQMLWQRKLAAAQTPVAGRMPQQLPESLARSFIRSCCPLGTTRRVTCWWWTTGPVSCGGAF
ncbi:hypothetical protein GCM10022403_050700 [Streptomyces coacervatus]|uniref:Uncharacterized protein n=1 Tax=Streptomyces coacervatus TaxID=647381 RepID=A0ABP7I5S9_9ACTN|nr:hypothetical protein [Streptomyces coacervatus]